MSSEEPADPHELAIIPSVTRMSARITMDRIRAALADSTLELWA